MSYDGPVPVPRAPRQSLEEWFYAVADAAGAVSYERGGYEQADEAGQLQPGEEVELDRLRDLDKALTEQLSEVKQQWDDERGL